MLTIIIISVSYKSSSGDLPKYKKNNTLAYDCSPPAVRNHIIPGSTTHTLPDATQDKKMQSHDNVIYTVYYPVLFT